MSMTSAAKSTSFDAELRSAFAARSKKSAAQAAAFDRFTNSGFPNRRREGWKWSDFNAALRQAPPETSVEEPVAPIDLAGLDPLEFSVIDGKIVLPEGAPPEGLRFGIMDPCATIADLEPHPMASLNVAMASKALGIQVQEGVQFERPIVIRHIGAGAPFAFAQTLIRISNGASARLIEIYQSPGAGFYSHLRHAALHEGARLQRALIHMGSSQSVIHDIWACRAEARAVYTQNALSTGARLARFETLIHCCEEDGDIELNSAQLLNGARHADFTSEVKFIGENCKARQLYKSVIDEKARGVFQGKFHVARGAQKTDAKMAANALLLSDSAEANHKPELEIYADDVECAHGSTVGALDREALFYLRQRGLTETQARALLIEAFVGEVADKIEDDALRNVVTERIANWLEAL